MFVDLKEAWSSHLEMPGELYVLLHFSFMFLRVILLFIVTLALRKPPLTDSSGSRSCSLSIKQVQHVRR